jgi:hypothetical protein
MSLDGSLDRHRTDNPEAQGDRGTSEPQEPDLAAPEAASAPEIGDDTHPDLHEPAGTEPANARSAYSLRATLSCIALFCAVLATPVFLWLSTRDGPGSDGWTFAAVVCGITVVVAAADLAVLYQRRRGVRRRSWRRRRPV